MWAMTLMTTKRISALHGNTSVTQSSRALEKTDEIVSYRQRSCVEAR